MESFVRLIICLLMVTLAQQSHAQIAPIKKSTTTTTSTTSGSESKTKNTQPAVSVNAQPAKTTQQNTVKSKRTTSAKSSKSKSAKNRLDYDHYSAALEKAAVDGDTEAQQAIAEMYYSGDGVKENKALAAHWMEKAATKGVAEAQAAMGYFWETGIGVDSIDYSIARDWYEKAAKQNNETGQYRLGLLYYRYGNLSKSAHDDKTANEYYSEAATQFRNAAGHDYAPAMYQLGVMHINGNYLPQDESMAADWFARGAKLDDDECLYAMGLFSRNSRGGVKHDEAYAYKCFLRSHELGNSNATNELGVSYQFGLGVDKDERKAMELYADAVGAGCYDAGYNWAYCAYYGIGIDSPKKEKALETMVWAAENGNMNAVDFLCEYQNENFKGEGLVSVSDYKPKRTKACDVTNSDGRVKVVSVSYNKEFIRLDLQVDMTNSTHTAINRDTWISDDNGGKSQLVYATGICISPNRRWVGSKMPTLEFSLYFYRQSIKGNAIHFKENGSNWEINNIPMPK